MKIKEINMSVKLPVVIDRQFAAERNKHLSFYVI